MKNGNENNNSEKKVKIMTRLCLDTLSGILAGFIVSPIIAPVDVSVISAQSGKGIISLTFFDQLRQIILCPHKYFISKPFLYTFMVYSSTYTANNCIDSLCKIYHVNDVIPKLIGITAINMYTSIVKDAAFAKIFGTKSPTKVPLISYLFWTLRDVISMAAAFILPQRLSKFLEEKNKIEKSKAEKYSLFAVPMLLQFIVLPISLMGFDFYNVNQSKFINRIKRLYPNFPNALPLRFYRMGGAYGVGGINNKKFRNVLISKYEGKDWDLKY